MTRTPRKMVFAKVGEELEEQKVEGGGKSGLGLVLLNSSCLLYIPMGRASRLLPI